MSNRHTADERPRVPVASRDVYTPVQSPVRIQAKLTVGAAGDAHEHEADRIADAVMRMPEPHGRSQNSAVDSEHATTPAARVQTKSMSGGDSAGIAAPPVVHEVLNSPGQPLDAATRAFMEPRFGHDFSNVRVHDNAHAADAARALDARAYAVGANLVFGAAQHVPQSTLGKELMAHELAHVLQQTGGRSTAGNPQRTNAQANARVMRQSTKDQAEKLKSSLFANSADLNRVLHSQSLIGPETKGTSVALIQVALNTIYAHDPSFAPLQANGIFDKRTRAAVGRFQTDKAAKKGTNGIVGTETIARLDEALLTRNVPAFAWSPAPGIASANLPAVPTYETAVEPGQKAPKRESTIEYFQAQRVTNPHGTELSIARDAKPMLNSKGQAVAYFVKSDRMQGLFVFNEKRGTWTRDDGVTDVDLMEDAVMRETEPFSWGVHKAAHDAGGAAIKLASDPIGSLKGVWGAIKGLKDIDIDQTWERIKNMDATDVTYVMTTLLMAKVGGPKSAGSTKTIITSGETILSESMIHGEEIYAFISKQSTTLAKSFSNEELYKIVSSGGSRKLGTALKAGGEIGAKGFHAHHIIPLKLIGEASEVGDFVRKAYEASWGINAQKNGIWVKAFRRATDLIEETGEHAYHPGYTKRVASRIQKFIDLTRDGGKTIDGNTARAFLENETAKLKEIIRKESVEGGKKINALDF